jgi:hypothetical protein
MSRWDSKYEGPKRGMMIWAMERWRRSLINKCVAPLKRPETAIPIRSHDISYRKY